MATTAAGSAAGDNNAELPPPPPPSASDKTGFLKTCFNGVNALSGIISPNLPAGKMKMNNRHQLMNNQRTTVHAMRCDAIDPH